MKNSTSENMYKMLLHLYPASYRKRYEVPMMQLFRDLHKEALNEGFAGLLVLWVHVFFMDFIPSLIHQYSDKNAMEDKFQKGGEIMPKLLWKSAALLFVPGFVVFGAGIGLFLSGEPMAGGGATGLGAGIIAMTIGLMRR